MTPEQRQQLIQKLDTGLLLVWGIALLFLPLLYLTVTTDGFILPKQLLMTTVVLLSILGYGAKMLLEQQVRWRRTPFDIPFLLLGAALVLSALFSPDRLDSLFATIPTAFSIVGYFCITNLFRKKQNFLFLALCLLIGILLTCTLSILGGYKVYLLPFASSHTQYFTAMGSLLDQALFLVVLLPVALSLVLPTLKKRFTTSASLFAVLASGMVLVLAVTVYWLVTSQKPVLLPFGVGFQTAFAAISQDASRIAQGFFFGSGYGNYAVVYNRFHPASFNADNQLWYIPFTQSSSFVLELLATAGIVGILGYFFLLLRLLTPVSKRMHNPVYWSLVVAAVLSFLFPFSYTLVALFVILTGLFALYEAEVSPQDYFDIELKIVALKKGMLNFIPIDEESRISKKYHPTPLVIFLVLLVILLTCGFYVSKYVLSDMTFQRSLQSATQNNGTLTYQLQTNALTTFPYRSAYFRIFSQTNIALANALLAAQGHASPSAQVQQTAYTLIQQSITSARNATNLDPYNAIEWQNLSSVYRSLIGVGQGSESFAIAAGQQAAILDSSNPQEFVALGGIYFQLGQYDNAIREFQTAISLKQDYANAYYNLGHAYEQKGDLQNALAQYQIVRQLVAADKTNAAKMDQEIATVQAKIGSQTPAEQNSVGNPTSRTASSQQQPLSLPSTQSLPAQKEQLPLVSPSPTK